MRYAIKRRAMRVRCLTGRHDHKMGAPAKGGGGFGCLWCRTPATYESVQMPTQNTDKPMPHRKSIDPVLAEAERQVRRLFGGKP